MHGFVTDLEQRLAAGQGFRDGHRPRSTTTQLSDGSLLDGDDTDWHRR